MFEALLNFDVKDPTISYQRYRSAFSGAALNFSATLLPVLSLDRIFLVTSCGIDTLPGANAQFTSIFLWALSSAGDDRILLWADSNYGSTLTNQRNGHSYTSDHLIVPAGYRADMEVEFNLNPINNTGTFYLAGLLLPRAGVN